jgi:hypothetical protein
MIVETLVLFGEAFDDRFDVASLSLTVLVKLPKKAGIGRVGEGMILGNDCDATEGAN